MVSTVAFELQPSQKDFIFSTGMENSEVDVWKTVGSLKKISKKPRPFYQQVRDAGNNIPTTVIQYVFKAAWSELRQELANGMKQMLHQGAAQRRFLSRSEQKRDEGARFTDCLTARLGYHR